MRLLTTHTTSIVTPTAVVTPFGYVVEWPTASDALRLQRPDDRYGSHGFRLLLLHIRKVWPQDAEHLLTFLTVCMKHVVRLGARCLSARVRDVRPVWPADLASANGSTKPVKHAPINLSDLYSQVWASVFSINGHCTRVPLPIEEACGPRDFCFVLHNKEV